MKILSILILSVEIVLNLQNNISYILKEKVVINLLKLLNPKKNNSRAQNSIYYSVKFNKIIDFIIKMKKKVRL